MNYTGIFDDPSGIMGYMMETFQPMNPLFWVIIFGALICYVYLASKSLIAAVILILITFATFGGTVISGYFSDVPIFTQFLYIITLFGIASLIFGLVMKRRF
jgi:hypothetical protein